MLKIGITGGIGSGKTTVCKIFESLGIPVYYADDRAKWLMENDPKLVAGLKNMFGENVFDAGGKLNRTLIAQSVFSRPSRRIRRRCRMVCQTKKPTIRAQRSRAFGRKWKL